MINWDFPYPSRRMTVMADNLVTTSQPLASQAGLQMLLDGGNAVDAALAAAIALTVVEPTGNGLGSDAFAQVWDGRGLYGINGSGRSPRTWSPRRFAGCEAMPERGWEAVTVPGAVSVWVELSRRFGKLPFSRLFEPALHYARLGYPVSPLTAARWRSAAEVGRDNPEFCRTFLPGGEPPAPGTRICLPEAAATLAEIRDSAGESFYRGGLARIIARASLAAGAALDYDDLATHRAEWVEPLSCVYRGCELFELPPNGQGITALIALGILERFDLGSLPVDSPESIHLQVEAIKLAFADVLAEVADPASMRIAPEALLRPEYLQRRAAQIDPGRAGRPLRGLPADGGTVCLATADAGGMMVSFIQSNFHGFGSGVVVPGTGISLNNRGSGFSLEADHPNRVAGGKKPFHTIIPGFVMHQDRPLLAFGVMGAHMQAQGHVQMLTRICDYHQNPQAASDAPRWQLTRDLRLALEQGFDPETASALQQRGHRVTLDEPESLFGGAQLIMNTGSCYLSGSDHRKDGQAVGF